MEPASSTHPSPETLRAYAQGRLGNSAEAPKIAKHIEKCAECRRRIGSATAERVHSRSSQSQASVPATRMESVPNASALGEIAGLPPELVNHPQYEVTRELGKGGMGVVYLARNKLMGRQEVLKVVNQKLLHHSVSKERFLREIQSAAMLSHPHVVSAYSVLPIGELLVFAMEYIDGVDLAKLVKTRGPLPILNACYYAQQVALALQHAFERKMVHRDIKPQNLMLLREGKKHIVKVLDFGLAKMKSEQGEDHELTGAGQALGTPDYMAPEQSIDAATADIRADIYSLGCTVYYLLTGSPPFSGRTLYEIFKAHETAEAKPLDLVRPDVPEELAAIVRKMMAKDPGQRYQTPIEVAHALSQFIKTGAAAGAPAVPSVSLGPPSSSSVAAETRTSRQTLPEPTNPGSKTGAPTAKADTHVQWDTLAPPKTGRGSPASGSGALEEHLAPGSSKRKWVLGGAGAGVLVAVALATFLASGNSSSDPGEGDHAAIDDVQTKVALGSKRPRDQGNGAAEANAEPSSASEDRSPGADEEQPGARANGPFGTGGGGRRHRPQQNPGAVASKDTLAKRSYELSAQKVPDDTNEMCFSSPETGPWFEHWKGRIWIEHRRLNNPGSFLLQMNRTDSFVELIQPARNRQTIVRLQATKATITGNQGRPQEVAGQWTPTRMAAGPVTMSAAGPFTAGPWVSLFNGNDLSGWKVIREDQMNRTFEGESLVVRTTSVPGPCVLCTERSDYSNFHFRMKAMVAEGHSAGQLFRANLIAERDGQFLVGYTAHIPGPMDLPAEPAGSLFLAGDGFRALPLGGSAVQTSVRPGQWFAQEIVVEGNHLRVLVNGQEVVNYTDTNQIFSSGSLALICRPSSTVRFRDVEVQELLPASVAAMRPGSPSTVPGSKNAPAIRPPTDGNSTSNPKDEQADAIAAALNQAKQEYEAGMRKADETLLAAFAKEIEALKIRPLQGSGDRLKQTDAIEDERALFQRTGRIPWSSRMRRATYAYLMESDTQRRQLEHSFGRAIDAEAKAGNKNKARMYTADKEVALRPKVLAVWTSSGLFGRGSGAQWEFRSDGHIGDTEAIWRLHKNLKVMVSFGGKMEYLCTISADGKRMSGTNQMKQRITATLDTSE